MKRFLFLLVLVCTMQVIHAQYIYTIKADSVKITNSCDTAELIIENHTQTVPGFLFNKGRGRTEFRRGLLRVSDSLYIVGGDTLRMNPWLQGGNRFGTTGSFGTMDSNHIDFYTNGLQRGRWANTGNLLIGNGPDNGYKLQIHDKGSIVFSPTLSRPNDMIIFGGYLNPDDGQNMIINTTSDGITGHAVLMERDGNIGMGWGSPTGWSVGRPTFRIDAGGIVSIASTRLYFGQTGGPINSSGLVTSVSNGNEWQDGWGYPNGANYYYFGTTLQGATAGNSRAPLRIGAKNLTFLTGPAEPEGVEALRITDSGRIGIGTIAPSAQLHTTGSVRFAGLTNDNSLTRIVVSDASGNLSYRDYSTFVLNKTMNSDLAVNGTVSAQKMLISQTGRWPDYVFSKQYQLPSLTEVESFINQNNHLPGIPSAAEVEKKGIDVANNQAALLKKIEELTLYVIEQEKQLQNQKEEISGLKKQNSELSELKKQIAELMTIIKGK